MGYKVQLTETCDADAPRLITHFETTPATTPDNGMVPVVHAALAARDLLPAEHLVDKGYTDAKVLADSQRVHAVRLVGPVADDPSWQARADEGLAKADFVVDWARQVVRCPAGKESHSWQRHTVPKHGVAVAARLASRDCTPCPLRVRCTRAAREPRIVGLQTREREDALQAARRTQGHRRVSDGVRGAGRDREHARAGDAPLWAAPLPVSRPGEDAPAARGHGRRAQRGARGGVDSRQPPRPDPPVDLQPTPDGCLTRSNEFATSVTVGSSPRRGPVSRTRSALGTLAGSSEPTLVSAGRRTTSRVAERISGSGRWMGYCRAGGRPPSRTRSGRGGAPRLPCPVPPGTRHEPPRTRSRSHSRTNTTARTRRVTILARTPYPRRTTSSPSEST